MYPVESAVSIDLSQEMIATQVPEEIPGITELIGSSLRESVSQLQRREIQQISSSLDELDDQSFRQEKLSLSQVAVMSIRNQSCNRLITRLPDLDEGQLRILLTLAPKHLMTSILEKLYPHQIMMIASSIPAEAMEDLLSVAQASTVLAILPQLSIDQLRSMLRSVSYDLCMTILPLLRIDQVQNILPSISNEYRIQYMRTLLDLPDEVLSCQFPKIPPAHLLFAFTYEELPERMINFCYYLTNEQIAFIVPNLNQPTLCHLLEHSADEKRTDLIAHLSEHQTAAVLSYFFESIPSMREHARIIPEQCDQLREQVIAFAKYSDSLAGEVSTRVWTNLISRWTDLQGEALQLIEQNREKARQVHTTLSLLHSESSTTVVLKQISLVMEHYASELANILKDISLVNQNFHLRIKQKNVTDTEMHSSAIS